MRMYTPRKLLRYLHTILIYDLKLANGVFYKHREITFLHVISLLRYIGVSVVQEVTVKILIEMLRSNGYSAFVKY